MSTSKSLDIRWIRRYKGFCIAGCVFLIIQVFLAYIFFTLHSEEPKDVQEYLTGYRKINFEAFEDRNGAESSRRFKENYLALEDDEEEGPGNSNAVEHRLKVPPDKPDEKSDDKVPVKSKGENRLSDGPSRTSGNKTSMLRLEELDFMPLCDIVGKEAISAIHRAKTQHCKQQLANITCLNIRGDLYPQWLPHTCPNNGYEAGKLLGCYKDDKAFRLLSGYYNNLKTSNSPQYCINLCLQSGFPFAGVQYMSECFCGNEEPLSTARLPDSSCNMKCPGDPKEACGGNYTMNIYQTGIAKFSPQPPNEPGTSVDRERPVRIAFLLTLNGRAVRQVYRLLKALFHKDHYFYIHIDSRQDYMFRELLALEMRLSNVRLSRRRHSTIWGGASLLTMLLESMLELVQADWDWDFVINLSESDFPVKTNMQLVEFLMANRERNFVKSHGREVQRFIQKQGLDKTFVECEAHMWRAGDRTLPWGIAMDGGSDWVALSRSFINYVTAEHKDRLISGLLTVFKYTLLPAELVEFLMANRERNFVKSHGREVQRFIQKQGLDKTFVECEAHMWRAGDRTLPWGIAMDGGSDWVALSRSFINYVTAEHKDRLISGLLTVFKYTLLPAESFFHTVLRNSEFCGSYVDNNLHVTNWKRRLGCKCQYKHVVDWCGCSPNNFKTEDWPRLQGTEARPLFFARKFEPIINQAIILQLEEWLYGTYPSNLTGLNSYWQSVYHYQDLSPASDDSLNTYVVSLTRLAARVLSNSVPDCLISPGKVLEVTSYLHNDKYKGTLIKYEARVKHLQSDIQLETWVRPHNNFSVFSSFGPAKRLKMMLVSSDYDQKEQTSRNLLRSLSIFSEPYLVYHFLSGTSAYNVTFLWIDPVGSLADVSEAYVDEVATINGVKASLKTPLLPGVWLLKMVYNNTVVAQTDFLVSPLQFSSGTAVTQQQAGLLHSGPGHPYKVTKDVSSLRKLIGVPNSTLQTRAAANAKRFGKDLVQWIDSLIVRFYTLVDSCVVSTQTVNVCKSLQLEPCRSTVWSSMAPDPKSTITTINKATGRLNRW